MNLRAITNVACLGAVLLVGHAVADNYKTITVSQTETQLLTTALATESNYDSDESDRVCFTTITKLKQKNESSTETKYKYYVQGCLATKATAQCTASCTAQPYEIKVIAKGTLLKVDDIDKDNGSGSDSSDSDDNRKAPAAATTNSTTPATKPTATAPKASTASAAAAMSSVAVLAALGAVVAQ